MALVNWFELSIQSLWNENEREKCLRAVKALDSWAKEPVQVSGLGGDTVHETSVPREGHVGPRSESRFSPQRGGPSLLSWPPRLTCTCSRIDLLTLPADRATRER